MSLEERAEEAEIRFKAIADRIKAREGPDKYATDIDFVEQNMSQSQIKPESKNKKITQSIELLKNRLADAKVKRNQEEEQLAK